jgi:hypothetical protein
MAPEAEESRGNRQTGCIIAVAVFAGVGLLGAIVGQLGEKQEESALDREERAIADYNAATLYAAEQIIRGSLKDPRSADFSGGYGRMKHGARVACGHVNGRNSLGAFAGSQPWIVVVEQNVAMVHAPDNHRAFAKLWNKYCTGLDDRDKPVPPVMFDVRFGSRPPATLKPFDEERNVWVYRGARPQQYLGVPISDAFFEAEHGRITGASVTAKGVVAYEQLRDEIRRRYGAPSSVGIGEPPILEWEWTRDEPMVQLSIGSENEDVLLRVALQAD